MRFVMVNLKGQTMKKMLVIALMAAGASAYADSCDDYFAMMEAELKKDGAYSEEAMKIVHDQIAAVPADQKEAVCKAAIESYKEDNAGEDGESEEEASNG